MPELSDWISQPTVHLCVDMQRMFAEDTEWHAPWLNGVLPAVEALAERHPERTIFTRFIPPQTPEQATGAWQAYYERWRSVTGESLASELLDLVPRLARFVPPGVILDKPVYSPWVGTGLNRSLGGRGIRTIVISGGETDVCVLAAAIGAIDFGYQVILAQDAVFGSADETHDKMLRIFQSRFGLQLLTASTEDILGCWRD